MKIVLVNSFGVCALLSKMDNNTISSYNFRRKVFAVTCSSHISSQCMTVQLTLYNSSLYIFRRIISSYILVALVRSYKCRFTHTLTNCLLCKKHSRTLKCFRKFSCCYFQQTQLPPGRAL
jgi:hypothetical protein